MNQKFVIFTVGRVVLIEAALLVLPLAVSLLYGESCALDFALTIVVALDDPTAYGAERVQLRDVLLDEITLSKFENKTLTEEEVPFTAGSYEFLDLIE